MATKGEITMNLNKLNREKTKPLAERPHAMNRKDVRKLFFDDTPFALVGEEE